MNPCRISLALIFLCFLIRFHVATSDPIHFTGDVSINCGSTGTSSAHSGGKWLGDVQPRRGSLLKLKGLSRTSTAIRRLTSTDPVPYKTARVSTSQFSYAFQVNPGQKIIRLHFNPSAYRGFKGLKDLFTVEAGPFTFLSNFSASLTADALRVNSLTKEFCLNIEENQLLNLTFSAETTQSKAAYAFINGIEIISVPDSLSYIQGEENGLQVVGQNSLVYVDNSIALEMIYRLNIKQDFVSSADDSDDVFGMSRKEVDNNNNVTWKISVDVGFRYLVRLYFSKLGLKMAETGSLNFKVFINEKVADTNIDIVGERDGSSNPWFGDYMVMMNGRKQEGKRGLLIHLQSNEEFMYGPLKGFEILKLSNPDNSLASPIPMPPSQDSTSQTIQILLTVLGHRNAISTVVITIISIVSIIVHMLRKLLETSSSEQGNQLSARAERLCRRFSLSEMQSATRNFSDGLIIGRGGFGKVYKGLIDKEQHTVAIKRLKSNSNQGAREFLMEIETLSELRHINLVSLIGYCSEGREMILVYEYMACGTLADHLYKLARHRSNCPSLSWKQCLDICIGAARGLDYLHTGHRVIHRDVKASNILLDDNFVAKVSDFGLAKAEDRSKLQSHVSTKVKGTYGYLDPFYFTTHKLTRKSDTYAFGVVLLEVLCGRPAVDSGVSEEERMLTTWARNKISNGQVDLIVASSLRDEISPNSLKIFVEITKRCIDAEPKNRPTMSQVVLQLECALEQQQDRNPYLWVHEIDSVSDENVDSDSTFTISLKDYITDDKVVIDELQSGRKKRGKSTRNKPSRLWPWNTFWNRVKPSKKHELFLSDVKLLKFDWDKISASTDHFCSDIVGRGRFGAIYKGILPTGEAIAVKRRTRLGDLKNEIKVLPNLQHPNIIKLLGYCSNGEEILLLYEFMENTSLDHFLGKGHRNQLEWAVRFQIIIGIARGLVYLHQDSGHRFIHRNLNLRNILLDLNMNPKICDFDLALSLAEDQSELETSRVIEAVHMPPESWQYGDFSVKTDVYSFGIILLEMVSGRRAFDINIMHRCLVKHAWKLWNEGRAIDLVDNSLGRAFRENEATRCIQVALLCIQEHPDQRPLMPSVIKKLEGNERLMLPRPPREVPACIS
ncbi:hypothetical protein ACS0TY_029130 [Phlomoides rotata]